MDDSIHMNHEEEKALEKLKIRVENDLSPFMREDSTLYYRFLKAQDFDVDKTEKMLRKHITWRKVMQADTILQNFKPNEFFEKYTKICFMGFDKTGDALGYLALGTLNVYEVCKSMKKNHLMKQYVWNLENFSSLIAQHSKEIGIRRHQGFMIYDLDKLTFKQATSKMTLNLLFQFLEIWQNNYPERVKRIYAINAPSFFIYVFSILKTVMSSGLIKKVHVFGYDGWKESLLEYVDPDVLPAFLGGKRTDPDGNPLCPSFINQGGRISEKYFLTDEERYFQSNAQINTITISRQEREEINVNIEKEGSLLKWIFLVENKDIGFGLSYRKTEHEIEEVLPVYRYETPDGTVEDAYKCPISGTYIIIFDNSFSWLSSKIVQYSISIENTVA